MLGQRRGVEREALERGRGRGRTLDLLLCVLAHVLDRVGCRLLAVGVDCCPACAGREEGRRAQWGRGRSEARDGDSSRAGHGARGGGEEASREHARAGLSLSGGRGGERERGGAESVPRSPSSSLGALTEDPSVKLSLHSAHVWPFLLSVKPSTARASPPRKSSQPRTATTKIPRPDLLAQTVLVSRLEARRRHCTGDPIPSGTTAPQSTSAYTESARFTRALRGRTQSGPPPRPRPP